MTPWGQRPPPPKDKPLHKQSDELWFARYFERQARIRYPGVVVVRNKQRAVRYERECEAEFQSLGLHNENRRRILLWRVPPDNPHYDPDKPGILKIPMLAEHEENIPDDDAVLLPMIEAIMRNAVL